MHVCNVSLCSLSVTNSSHPILEFTIASYGYALYNWWPQWNNWSITLLSFIRVFCGTGTKCTLSKHQNSCEIILCNFEP